MAPDPLMNQGSYSLGESLRAPNRAPLAARGFSSSLMFEPNVEIRTFTVAANNTVSALGALIKKEKLAASGTPSVFVVKQDLVTRVAHRLARIPDIVHAPDSILPSADVISAAEKIVGYLPAETKLPQIEIDDSTGAISLVWRDSECQNTFALEIPNSRCVIGVGFGEDFSNFQPWRHLVSEELKIVSEIQTSEPIRRLLGAK
jgi:hypothetical protein